MSDEPTTVATADETPQKQYGIAWGDEIDETRKQELWARLRAWWEETDHGERKGPFVGEKLTGAEVYWLAVCAFSKQLGTSADEAKGNLGFASGLLDDYKWSLRLLSLEGAYLVHTQDR